MNEEKRSTISEDGHLLDSQPNGPLYTVSQASVILQLPETWIYERTRKHAIPHRKLGKVYRFRPFGNYSNVLSRPGNGI